MGEKNLLTAVEVCAILEACAKAQVRELKFGALYVNRGPQSPVESESVPAALGAPAPVQLPTPIPVAAMTEAQHTQQSAAAIEQAELEAKEERLALLAIEDPVEYERQVMAGELEENGPNAGSVDDEEA